VTVTGRVAVGSGVLLALLAAVLGWHVWLVRRLHEVNRELAAVTLETATAGLDALRQLDGLDEYVRKFLVTRDPAYSTRAVEARDAFSQRLTELGDRTRPPLEAGALERLNAAWLRYPLAALSPDEVAARLAAQTEADGVASCAAPIEELRRHVSSLLDASRITTGQTIERSARAAASAAQLALAASGLALLASLLTVALTVSSIRAPLRRLTEATRAVAGGSFAQRLDTSGDDEFAAVAEDFNAMVRRLDELDRLKRSFVSHVSHELRTPLVAMEETTRLLLDGAPGPLLPKQQRLLDLNLQATRRLQRMITNLLDLSRLDAGAMRYDRRAHDLVRLVERSVAEIEAHAAESGVTLRLDAPADGMVIEADGDRVVQVVHNLLDNAVKHAPHGSEVTVSVAATSELPPEVPATRRRALASADPPAGWAVIEVADRGPGVPPEHRERIFARFQQLPGAGSGRGVGLGLAICQQLVDAHGGAIWAGDAPGGGASFGVALPRGAAVPNPAPEEGTSA
jgi:signal transduction histidine kinase